MTILYKPVKWSSIILTDSFAPEERTESSSCYALGQWIIFGGRNYDNSFNDLYTFDTELNQWQKRNSVGNLPSPRCGSSLTLIRYNKKIIQYQ